MKDKTIWLFCILAFLISCGTVKHGGINTIGKTAELPSFPIIKAKHDSIPPKKINPAQIQQFLEASYKYNYDKLFAPRFDQLNGVIKSQAASIQRLTIMYGDLRSRAVRNADKYNSRDSIQRVTIANYQKALIEVQQANLKAVKEQTASNQKQIKSSNKIIKYLAIGLLVLFVFVMGLYVFNIFLYNRIKQLQKSLNYD